MKKINIQVCLGLLFALQSIFIVPSGKNTVYDRYIKLQKLLPNVSSEDILNGIDHVNGQTKFRGLSERDFFKAFETVNGSFPIVTLPDFIDFLMQIEDDIDFETAWHNLMERYLPDYFVFKRSAQVDIPFSFYLDSIMPKKPFEESLVSASASSSSASASSSSASSSSASAFSLSDFDALVNLGTAFDARFNPGTLLGLDNKPAKVAGDNQFKKLQILEMAHNVTPFVGKEVLTLIDDFLMYKLQYGSTFERELYRNMDRYQFVERCFTKRPVAFYGSNDAYTLRSGEKGAGGFQLIGKDAQRAPLILADYLSYDEMEISALLGVTVPTYFINSGGRYNYGRHSQSGDYEEQGIQIGQVGARLEKNGYMDWKYMIVDPVQNTVANGYGYTNQNPNLLRVWEKAYDLKFPTYDEVVLSKNDPITNQLRFVQIPYTNRYLDIQAYKKRIKMVVAPFLLEANRLAESRRTVAYCVAVGLGLGVWAINNDLQIPYFLDAYAEVISELSLRNISDINFSWLKAGDVSSLTCGGVCDGRCILDADGNRIKIHFTGQQTTHGNPSDKLTGDDAGNLLVAQYAWDGNSYPGNEYWDAALAASGDPAAVCSSLASHLQNAEVNPAYVSRLQVHPEESTYLLK